MIDVRLSRVRALLVKNHCDALLVTSLPNIFYLSGFTGSTAQLLVTMDKCVIIVDSRYTLQASQECRFAKVYEYSGKTANCAASDLINELTLVAMAFEIDYVSVAAYRDLRKRVDSGVKFKGVSGLVETLRAIKDVNELELIRSAARITDSAFADIVGKIVPGMSEKDVALMIDSTGRRLGADKSGFETIAACGHNAACPHHSPTDDIIQAGQMLKMDFGFSKDSYNADITRTIFIGESTAKFNEIYQIVLDAQLSAIAAIRPGIAGRAVDDVARQYISRYGYGVNFGHGLGHALGIEVHDGPAFSVTSKVILEAGMVATVEPGIYIEGWGGIRIEDDVIVTAGGAEIITSSPK